MGRAGDGLTFACKAMLASHPGTAACVPSSFESYDRALNLVAGWQGAWHAAMRGAVDCYRLWSGGPHRQAAVGASDAGALQSAARGCGRGEGHQHCAEEVEAGPGAQA